MHVLRSKQSKRFVVYHRVGDNNESPKDLSSSSDTVDILIELPYWLILEYEETRVDILYHQPPNFKGNSNTVFMTLYRTLKESVKRVNQLSLLSQLHETKTCSPLLVPNDMSGEGKRAVNLKHKNTGRESGSLACDLVYSEEFRLYERLEATKVTKSNDEIADSYLGSKHS
jgi:hypothetical protein